MKLKKSKVRQAPKEKPAIVAKGKLEGRASRSDTCANCSGSKMC